MRIYFAGLLVFSAVLMFLHAGLLRVRHHRLHPRLPPASRPPSRSSGSGSPPCVINSRIIFPDPTADEWWTYGIIVVIQTVAIGFGIIGGEKISELSEQRRRSLLELEAALEENAGLHAQLVAQAREAGVTDERQRIAGEIHDTIAQGLTGVITQLEAASQVKGDPAELQRRLDNATQSGPGEPGRGAALDEGHPPRPARRQASPRGARRRGGALVVVEQGARRGDDHRRRRRVFTPRSR